MLQFERRRGSFLPKLLLWLVLLCGYCDGDKAAGTGITECPTRDYTPPELYLRDMGGLTALVESAESSRNGIVGEELPYKFIGTRAREAYNGSRSLTSSLFISEWMSYNQNALFIGGFLLFLGILLPGAAMSVWTFCECCYEEDEEEVEVNRNLTWQAQVVVWSLAVSVVAVLIVLLVMVGILLGANSWISQGVDRSSAIVRRTIPQLIDMKEDSFTNLESILVQRYDNLTSDLQTNILDQVPLNLYTAVSNQHQSSTQTLNNTITEFLSMRPRPLRLADSLTSTLSTLHNITTSLHHSLTLIKLTCSQIQDEGNTSVTPSLIALCEDYAVMFTTLAPISHWNELGGVSVSDNQSQLTHVQSLLGDGVFSERSSVTIPQLFQDYLYDLMMNLSHHINSTTMPYFSSLSTNLSDFTEEVIVYYNTSLPLNSQSHIETYLGARHLENWQWFRSALTITFSIFVYVGAICLLLALGRGLYFVTATYRYSDDSVYVHGAHQAGLIIKKISFSLSIVCILSASFAGGFLSVAGVMGKVCGNHNNFSEVLKNVIDAPFTWSEREAPFYPLADLLLNKSEYPLIVGNTLNDCRSNVSLFHAFHLEQRYDLEERIWLSQYDKDKYRGDLQSVYRDLSEAHLTPPLVARQLAKLNEATTLPIQWAELTELSSLPDSSLFQDGFIGFDILKETLEDLMIATGNESSVNMTGLIEMALEGLDLLVNQLQSNVSLISEGSLELQSTLFNLHHTSPSPLLSQLSANITLTSRSNSNRLVTLASEMVGQQLEKYLNSTIINISCNIGTCRNLATDYDAFAGAVCGDVIPGLDLYWTGLLITLSISFLLMILSLLVASRFISLELWKSHRKNPKFYLNSAVMRQLYSTLWQFVSIAIYLWWLVHVSQDSLTENESCSMESGRRQARCCLKCVLVFGIIFLVLSGVVGGVSRIYQYFTLYMIKKCEAMKYRRFWIDRKKAVNFYGQLILFFIQDLPFLILVGTYASQIDFLSVPSFYSLVVSLLGMFTYVVYIVRQRHNITVYWAWLKLELGKVGLRKNSYVTNQEALPTTNGNVGGVTRRGGASAVGNGHVNPIRSPYMEGSGSDHSENSSQGTFQDHGFEFHPPRLSDIPEYPEGGLEAIRVGGTNVGGGIGLGLPRIGMETHHNDDGSEISDQHSQYQSRVRLDRDIEQDSEAYLQRRRDAIDNFERGGVEIAPSHYYHRDIDASTISDSYYCGSRNSVELHGYVSSSQAPDDTNSYYESSDCRDEDGDSVYSAQARYRLPVRSFMGEVTVDV